MNSSVLLKHKWKGRVADTDTAKQAGVRCGGSYNCANVLGLYPVVMQTS